MSVQDLHLISNILAFLSAMAKHTIKYQICSALNASTLQAYSQKCRVEEVWGVHGEWAAPRRKLGA